MQIKKEEKEEDKKRKSVSIDSMTVSEFFPLENDFIVRRFFLFYLL
jgi:hypothetical protein